MQNLNRRSFFSKIVKVSAVAAAAGTFSSISNVFAQDRRKKDAPAAAGGEPSFVVPGQGMAANVNYQEDHKKVKDASLKVTKDGVPFEKQHCGTCMLYTKYKNEGGIESGKCTLFPGQKVKSTGWCTSWALKK